MQNLRWLLVEKKKLTLKPRSRFIICIPVLREQRVINETLDYFLGLTYPSKLNTLVFVTTQKEGVGRGSTHELLKARIATLPEFHQKRVKLIHYVQKTGSMAHQINYAAQIFDKDLQEPDTYFTVYNADSRPNLATLEYVDAAIQNYRASNSKLPTVLQQSSLFTTVPVKKRGFGSYIARGAAIHQSLWTLTQEITRFRIQSRNIERLGTSQGIASVLRFSRIAHCVGHGLFVHGSHYRLSSLPDELLNEDLPYGLLQCALRQPILPIQLLEIAESPNQLRNVYAQKRVWFNPFFEFLGYGRSLHRSHLYVIKFELIFLTLQAYALLIIWLIRSAVWLALIVLSYILGTSFIALLIILFAAYWLLPAYLYTRTAARRGWDVTRDLTSVLCGSLYAMTDSVGPMLSVFSHLYARIVRKPVSKPKTENA